MDKRTISNLGVLASNANVRSHEWKWILSEDWSVTVAHLDGKLLTFATEKLARKAAFGLLDRVTVVKGSNGYTLSAPANWR